MIDAGGSVEETRSAMTITEAAFRAVSEAAAPPGDAEATSSGSKAVALVVAILLALGAAAALGYTQWWVPREQAQQTAQLKYEQCLQEVKAYKGKRGYQARVTQCNSIPHRLATPAT